MSKVWRWPAWLRSPWTTDAALALAVMVVEVAGVMFGPSQPDGVEKPLDAFGYALLIVSSGSLALRRHYPSSALLIAIIPMLTYYPSAYPEGGPVYLATLIALYTAASQGKRRLALAVLIVAFMFNLTGGFLPNPGEFLDGSDLAWSAGAGAAVIIGGEVSRNRRAYLAEVEERAAQAERVREEEARRRADEERLRIARELHDVLAHNISMMNVQAGVAAHLLHEQPEQAQDALLTIKQSSKDALRELRATLGTLRRVDDTDGTAARAPTPGLARLDDLVARATGAGLAVDVHTEGQACALPDGVDLAAYRIVQEALTNVTRHAHADSATVLLAYGERELCIQVDDNGHGTPAGKPGELHEGNGLVGMRERAEGHGGRLTAGARGDGGFRVRARLPVDGEVRADGAESRGTA